MRTKLIFSDVDNTLVTHDSFFSSRLIKEMKRCLAQDIEFILCSGRPTYNLIEMTKILKEQHQVDLRYVVGFNGANIYDVQTQESFYDIILDTALIRQIFDFCEANSLDYIVYDEEYICCSNPDGEYAKIEQNILNMKLKSIEAIKDTYKVLILVDPEKNDAYQEKLMALNLPITVAKSMPFFIEVTKQGVTKGQALIDFCAEKDIDLQETICFGDSGNDIAMFEVAPVAYAVDNAIPQIKELATGIIDSVEDDGVAKFLEKNI